MRRATQTAAGAASLLWAIPAFAGNWLDFANETATRMPTGPGLNTALLSTTDPEEKDYAWGDVDQDGDIDLVVVRKQPFTTTGRKVNVLFMNEGIGEGHSINGVLVDRTARYVTNPADPPADHPGRPPRPQGPREAGGANPPPQALASRAAAALEPLVWRQPRPGEAGAGPPRGGGGARAPRGRVCRARLARGGGVRFCSPCERRAHPHWPRPRRRPAAARVVRSSRGSHL